MLRLIILITPGLLLLAGVLYLSDADNTIGVNANEESHALVVSDTSEHTAPLLKVTVAPDLIKQGNDFDINSGLKDVLDSLIFSSNASDKTSILEVASNYCHEQSLSERGCARFLDLMARYVDYKLALQNIERHKLNIEDQIAAIDYQFDALRQIQSDWFTQEELDALFANDWRQDEQALARKRIALNKLLSKEEKQQLLTQQLHELSVAEQRAFTPTLQMNRLSVIKNTHADRQLALLDIETEMGTEAALRLEATWNKQDVFQGKIDKVSAEFLSILTADIDDAEKAAQQNSLLARHFSGNEIRRAKAILKHFHKNI